MKLFVFIVMKVFYKMSVRSIYGILKMELDLEAKE